MAAIITFKEFLGEDREMSASMLEVQTAVAAALKIPRYKVIKNRLVVDGDHAFTWQFAVRLAAEKDDMEFYARMFEKLLKRELAKVFDKFETEPVKVTPWQDGQFAVVIAHFPDATP